MTRKRVNSTLQGEIRRRARFRCQAEDDNKISLVQLAHIIPDSEGGEIDINNIVWLCESCQRKFEVAGKSGLKKIATIKRLEAIRDKPQLDSLVDGIFDDLLALDDVAITVQVGSVGFRSVENIFTEKPGSYRPAFLKFYRDGHTLRLKGHLKDINGFTLIEFDGNKMHFHTRDVWDIERRAQYLKLTSSTQNIWIEIKQIADLTVEIMGQIYAGEEIMAITKLGGIAFQQGRVFHGFTILGNGQPGSGGIELPASPIPRPYGHVDPNVKP